MKNNYHTHLKYCNHATGVTEDYVKEAIKLGFNELAITDHAPIPVAFMTKEEYKHNWCSDTMPLEFIDKYIKEIKDSKELHKNEIKVLSGFETEYLPGKEAYYKMLRDKTDFLNLGVHYFKNKKGHVLNTYGDINYKNVSEYKDTCIEAMKTGLFNTLVHPDLFFYGYKDKNGNHFFDEECIKVSKEIIESAIKYISSWKYPIKDFWIIAKEYKDLKIIVGCDAHAPERLSGFHVDAIYKLIDEIGLNVLEKMEINH